MTPQDKALLERLNALDEKRKKALAEYQAFCDIEPPAAENTQKWSKLYCKKEKLERQIQDSGLQILALANRLAGELEQYQWQPIETAPKDGTRVLLVDADNKCLPFIACYNAQLAEWRDGVDCWVEIECYTHWQPLPPTPETSA